MSIQNDDPLLTTAQAAEYLGLRPVTLHNWRSQGIPDTPDFVRMGRFKIFYRRSVLDAYINAHEVKSAAGCGR